MSRRIAFVAFTQHISDAFLNGIAKACIKKGHCVKRFHEYGNMTDYNYDVVAKWSQFDIHGLNSFDPETLVIFNGYAKETSGVTSYLRRKYNTVFVERGWFPQKGHVYMDKVGLGGRSSLASQDLTLLAGSDYKNTANAVRAKYAINGREDYGDYILVPLQLDHDTSVVLDSPYFKSMESMLQFIKHYFPKEKIIVTPHPHNKDIKLPKGFFLLDSVPTIELAKSARAIIGINSTVMIESLMFHKPVGMLGTGVLTGSNVMPSPESMLVNPRQILDYKPNPEKIDKAISVLNNIQFDCINTPENIVNFLEL